MRSFVSVAFDAAKEQSFYDPLKPHTAHLGLAITLPRPRSCRAQVLSAGRVRLDFAARIRCSGLRFKVWGLGLPESKKYAEKHTPSVRSGPLLYTLLGAGPSLRTEVLPLSWIHSLCDYYSIV